ncbi:MAG: 7-carboxy-7-deazaguanine synthase QueE [Candidatus Symbiothrix sp.]|jgi:organic radical activating enzyme|nr:7-carboxy-7-deazaguanine synthase QueE [Candidatus Symbiothrix sp.]
MNRNVIAGLTCNSLKVHEIFYSLQGEGGRQGEASIFIRLAGCNLRCDFCDTDFEDGTEMTLEAIHTIVRQFPCQWIVWTGGEPTLQLTDDRLWFFKNNGYKQAVESNGTQKLSPVFDYTVVSPKGNVEYAKQINPQVDEVRLPLKKGDTLPAIDSLPKAKKYFVSPIFTDHPQETKENINYCVKQVLSRPQWKLSVQIHKLIGIE